MNRTVLAVADVVISPLGNSSKENFKNLLEGKSGVSKLNDSSLGPRPIVASKLDLDEISDKVSRFEALAIRAIKTIAQNILLPSDRTLFILSTTKGNVAQLSKRNGLRLQLHETSKFLAAEAGLKNHVVVSNACISGVVAITVAKRYLQAGIFDHALVLGIDELNSFVTSGFQSLNALSDEPCKPFDVERKGINLGEAAAAILLTTLPAEISATPYVEILGSGITNDANHISGPSRTGEELAQAINLALLSSHLSPGEIDFVSAHGTATIYNDEMEAKALHLARLSQVPVNSLKAFYGHTLGAAGILETVMSIQGLMKNTLIPSLGFSNNGVSQPVNVITKVETKALTTFLKTASGFGGCNAAIALRKI